MMALTLLFLLTQPFPDPILPSVSAYVLFSLPLAAGVSGVKTAAGRETLACFLRKVHRA